MDPNPFKCPMDTFFKACLCPPIPQWGDLALGLHTLVWDPFVRIFLQPSFK